MPAGNLDAIVNQQGKTINGLVHVVTQAAAKEQQRVQEEQADKIKSTMIEIQSKLYDKAMAYTNLVMVGGYAGIFTTWSATRAQLTPKANIVIALLASVSLAFFVFFEVYKMAYTGFKLMKQRGLLVAEVPPEQFLQNQRLFAEHERKLPSHFMPIWIGTMVVCIPLALFAFLLLFYNYFAILVGWPLWPQ